MADLSLGLVGLAVLPTLFFFISLKLDESLRIFKIAFSGLGFVFLLVFLAYSTGYAQSAEQIWGLFIGLLALFAFYFAMEGINIILNAIRNIDGKKGSG